MKKFSFKKIGILLAMMLVAGAALVGPVSAFAENTEETGNGNFWISATGNMIDSTFATFSGYTWLKGSGTADEIYVRAQLYNQDYSQKDIIYDTDSDISDFEVSKVYTGGNGNLNAPFVKATMNSDNPDDMGYVYAYGI